MDICLYGKNNRISAAEIAPQVDLTAEQVENVFKDIESKRAATQYLHRQPLLIETVPEI
jgi:NAD+ synthase